MPNCVTSSYIFTCVIFNIFAYTNEFETDQFKMNMLIYCSEKTTYKFGIDLSFKSEGKTVEKNTDDGGVNLMR